MATKDTDDRPVVEQLPAGGETVNKGISRQRRKIIKASAAVVPAIMTIRSGAAAAMTSVNQCEEKDAAAAALLPASMNVVAEPDEWVRMGAWKIEVVIGNPHDPATVLYGIPDNGVVPSTLNDYSVWYDESGNTNSKKNKEYVKEVTKDEFNKGERVFCMCYVNIASGTFSVYPQQPVVNLDVESSPITASCLTSVSPDFTMN